MAVCTDSIQHNTSPVTCDTYQPTRGKGYRRVFMYAGHLGQIVLQMQVIFQRVRTLLCISKEEHLLEVHGGTSNALFCLNLTL